MSKDEYNWIEVNENFPCPICKSDTWCGVLMSDMKVRCKREEAGSYKTYRMKDGSFSYYHSIKPKQLGGTARLKARKVKPLTPVEMESIMQRCLLSPRLQELSSSTGISAKSFKRLSTGHDGKSWVNPEKDEHGIIVGIKRRFMDGKKIYYRGSKPGLYIPDGWYPATRIFFTEGMTDTAACLDMGLSAIGRPSNIGGLREVASFLKSFCSSIEIVIVAENDYRWHESCKGCEKCGRCWPGKHGALQLYSDLRQCFSADRKIYFMMPPTGAKDIRGCLNAGMTGDDLLKLSEVLECPQMN